MLPISDDNSGRRIQPYVTYVLIAINVLVFMYQFTLNEREAFQFLHDWALTPGFITSGEQLHTLITHAFLHGSWFHVLSNMLFLWIFGDNVEDVMGHVKYIIFYLITALAAGGGQILIDMDSMVPMVGASGAVSGIMAAYVVFFPNGRIRTLIFFGIFITFVMLPAWWMIGYWFIIQLVSGFFSLDFGATGGGTAYWAHIGGFVAGFILARFFANKDQVVNQRSSRTNESDVRSWGIGQGRR